MKYRECIIVPSEFNQWMNPDCYKWYHPIRADYDDYTGHIWSGHGKSIEECIIQIDRWYEL